MFRVLQSLVLASVALSFSVRRSGVGLQSIALHAKSKALPFLDAPAKLDGTIVGDFGFDPLGFTDTLNDLSYVRDSELKHGRVAMLATVGFVFQQYVHILTPEANPLKAIEAVGFGPNVQILFGIGMLELINWKKTYDGENPGDFGFDPLGQLKGKTAKQVGDLKLKELKNGRLAMVAFIGMFAQNLVLDGQPTLQF